MITVCAILETEIASALVADDEIVNQSHNINHCQGIYGAYVNAVNYLLT